MRDNPLFALIYVLAPFSLLSFGGGPSIFAPLQHQTVDVWHWVSAREYIDLFAIARTAPGPGAMLSTLIGWKIAGWTGALVATIALFAPSSILCFFVARWYDRFRGRDWHTAIEQGLAPIAVGLIFSGALAVLQLGGGRALNWIVAVAAGALLSFRPKMHPFVILFAGAVVFVAAEFAGAQV